MTTIGLEIGGTVMSNESSAIYMASQRHAQAEADSQREPELSNAEIAHKLYEICCDEDHTWEYCEEQIEAALDAKDTRSRPTVAEPLRWNFEDRDDGLYGCEGAHHRSHDCEWVKITSTNIATLLSTSAPTVEAAEMADFSEKFWGVVNEAIGDWGGSDKITTTRRAMYREAYDRISAVFAIEAARDAAPTPPEDLGDEATGG